MLVALGANDYQFRMATLLFDIDGTLVRTNGAGKAAMEAGLGAAFGVTEFVDSVPYAGRTDAGIGPDLLRVHQLPDTPENYAKLSTAYLAHLPKFLQSIPGEICPGVMDLLPKLRSGGRVRLGLLTGNARAGAQAKLSHFGLWDYFAFGGFGDAHPNRDDVAKLAYQAACDHGPTDAERVWVIGDTPLDVQCARAIGAKVVAVATGWHSYEELSATGADLVLEHLSDLARLPRDWFDHDS